MSQTENEVIKLGELWSVQESLLQYYRTIFITIELVILLTSAFMLVPGQMPAYAGLPMTLLGLALIPVWKGVCNARANAVAFIHWMIQKHEAGETIRRPYTHFRQFQFDRCFNDINVLQDEHFKSLCQSRTRRQLDHVVPMLFATTQLLMLVIVIMKGTAWI